MFERFLCLKRDNRDLFFKLFYYETASFVKYGVIKYLVDVRIDIGWMLHL